jgi:ATP-binding cassette subfamily B protein/ATP-binding cassette subfamily C protein/ATP-binding cassette subfamily B multidrug efflux pump
VQESLAGVRTLRALGLEPRSAEQFGALADQAAAASLSSQNWEAAYEPAVGLALSTAGLLTLALGGYLVWQGQLTVGALTSFTMYLGQLIWPMFAAGWVLALLERGKAAWSRLQPVLDAGLTVEDSGSLESSPQGVLKLEHVVFRYPGQQAAALDDVSFSLAPGKTLGIVGHTGAGKSTIVRLLLRQFETREGSLRWGGHALDEYRLHTLRDAINWVAQEPFLFSATVAANIALGKPTATRAQVEHAAKLAAMHEDIMRLPQGYDTPVGERGVTLSGGQRQRVAIARALLSDSPMLLLDDALSAVDTDTETRILRHLQQLRADRQDQGRSAVIVSHRLSAVADADHILVLRQGRIIEQGDHENLLEQGGWYAAQWRYQQLEASLDAA